MSGCVKLSAGYGSPQTRLANRWLYDGAYGLVGLNIKDKIPNIQPQKCDVMFYSFRVCD